MKVAWEPNDAGPPAGPATSMPGIKLEAPQPGPEPRGPDPLAALSNSVAPESNIGPGLCRYVTGPGRWQIRPRVGLKKPPALARQISVAGRAIQARAHIQRSGGNGRAGQLRLRGQQQGAAATAGSGRSVARQQRGATTTAGRGRAAAREHSIGGGRAEVSLRVQNDRMKVQSSETYQHSNHGSANLQKHKH